MRVPNRTYAPSSLEKIRLSADVAKYPRLVDLLSRLQASDLAVAMADAQCPRGADPLLSAELVERKLDGFAHPFGSDIPKLARARLVAFHYTNAASSFYVWPIEMPAPMATRPAAAMPMPVGIGCVSTANIGCRR
jgi:hypothetical protein